MNFNKIIILVVAVLFLVACKDNNVEKVNELLAQIEGLQESINKASNSSKDDDGTISVKPSAVDKEQALQNMISDLEDEMKELKAKNNAELALKKKEAEEISDLISRIEKGDEAVLQELKDNLTQKKDALQNSIDSNKSEFEAKKSEIDSTITELQSQLTEKKDNATRMERDVVKKQNELIANELKESTIDLKSVTTARKEDGLARNEYTLKYTDKDVTIKVYDSGAKEKETIANFSGVSGVAYKRDYEKRNANGKLEREYTDYLDNNKKLYSGSNTSYYGYERNLYYSFVPSTINQLPEPLFDLVSKTPKLVTEEQYKGGESGEKQAQKMNTINFTIEVLMGGFQVNLVAQETNNFNGVATCNTEKQKTTQASTTSWNLFSAGQNNKYMKCYAFQKGVQ